MFPDVQTVRQVQGELDTIIEQGVVNLVELLNNDENKVSTKKGSMEEINKEVCLGLLSRKVRICLGEFSNILKLLTESESNCPPLLYL